MEWELLCGWICQAVLALSKVFLCGWVWWAWEVKGQVTPESVFKSTVLPKRWLICNVASLAQAQLTWGRWHLCLFRSLAKGALIYAYTLRGFKKFSHSWRVFWRVYRLVCYWFPLGAGDSLLFALIQQFCLLNSNLGLKHSPIKPKLEDHPAEREAGCIKGPSLCIWAEGLCLHWVTSPVWKPRWSGRIGWKGAFRFKLRWFFFCFTP